MKRSSVPLLLLITLASFSGSTTHSVSQIRRGIGNGYIYPVHRKSVYGPPSKTHQHRPHGLGNVKTLKLIIQHMPVHTPQVKTFRVIHEHAPHVAYGIPAAPQEPIKTIRLIHVQGDGGCVPTHTGVASGSVTQGWHDWQNE